MTNTNRDFCIGERVQCKSYHDVLTTMLCLSSKGYGVAVFGYSDMTEHVVTVTEVPYETPIQEAET